MFAYDSPEHCKDMGYLPYNQIRIVDEWIEKMNILGVYLGCFVNSLLDEYVLIEDKALCKS